MSIADMLVTYQAKLKKARRQYHKQAVLSRLQGRVDALFEVGQITEEEKKIVEKWIAENEVVREKVGKPFPKKKESAPVPAPAPTPKKEEKPKDEPIKKKGILGFSL